jgi:quinoprotein glucose dehydrogenase
VLPTDCDFGPDGALWVADWVYGWEQTGKGRVYRAFEPEAQRSTLVAETRALLAQGMDGRNEDELVELLGHPDQRVRQEAHFALADRGTLARIASVAMDETNPLLKRLHALWALWIHARGGASDAVGPLVALAGSPTSEIRAQALRALGDLPGFVPETTGVVLSGLTDPEPRVRFFAALAAQFIQAEPLLLQFLAETGASDPNLRHAAIHTLSVLLRRENARASQHADPNVRLGVVVALRKRCERWRGVPEGALGFHQDRFDEARREAELAIAGFLLDEDPLVVLETARAIHDVPIEGALESLAKARVGAEQLAVGERALVRRVLNANYRLGRAETLAHYAERADLSVESRVEALDMLARIERPEPRDRVTNEWRPIEPRTVPGLAELAVRLAGTLGDAPDEVLEAFARFAGPSKATGAADRLAALVGERGRASRVKGAALEALEAMAAPNLVATVHAALGDVDGAVRASALERLERIAPAEVLRSLPEVAAQGEIAERRAAWRILARHAEPVAAETLARDLARLEQGLVPAELALDLVEAAAAQGSAELAATVARRRATLGGEPALAPYLDGLFGGEAGRGSDAFQRVDLSCTRCHAWWADASPRVGPNLFGVGARLTRLQLLESIVHPNRRTTPGFGSRVFFLSDGRTVSGRVYEESETLVRLFDANNNPLALERSEIEEERADLSAMPEDLAKPITPRDMRDLLEYLGTL